MAQVSLDMYQTLAIAVVALLIGAWLKTKIKVLDRLCIPSPVVGGLLFSIITCVLYAANIVDFKWDDTLKNVCMVIFFTSVGFQANVKVLKSGGKALIVLLFCVLFLIEAQDVIAVAVSNVIGVDPLIGLATGSISMVGGHGTAGAFGPVLEDMGVTGATTVATAAATFGLVAGSLIGGPLGNNLIKKKDLLKTRVMGTDDLLVEEEEKHHRSISQYAPAAYQLAIAMGIGTLVSYLLSLTGMTFPIYIGAMIVAAIMRNIGEYTGKIDIRIGEINDLGAGRYLPFTVLGYRDDHAQALAAGRPGTSDDHPARLPVRLHGALCALRDLQRDGSRLRCGRAHGWQLRFRHGRNAERHGEYAGFDR